MALNLSPRAQILRRSQHAQHVLGEAAAVAAGLGGAPGHAGPHLLRRPQHEEHDLAEAQHREAAALPAMAGRAAVRRAAGQPEIPLSSGKRDSIVIWYGVLLVFWIRNFSVVSRLS